MKISITQNHIDEADRFRERRKHGDCTYGICKTCPTALAIKAIPEFSEADVIVGYYIVHIGEYEIELPPEVCNFVSDYTDYKPVKPIEFELPYEQT